jgi:hypothetical protein
VDILKVLSLIHLKRCKKDLVEFRLLLGGIPFKRACGSEESLAWFARAGVTSEQNSLDQVKRETAIWRDAPTVVIEAFHRGYSTETLIDLLKGLQQFELKKQPNLSVNRFLSKLGNVKMTEEREDRNRVMDAEYAQTKKDLAEARGQVTAIMNSFIPTLNGALTSAKNEITTYRKAAVIDLDSLTNTHRESLANLEADAESKLGKINQLAQAQASYTNESMGTLYLNLSTAFKVYHDEVSKWGVMKVETGKFQAELKWGQYIQQLINDPKLAADMSTPLALQMADWLHIWVGKRLPEAKSLPPEHLSKQESGLSRYFPVKFTNITEWVRYELRDLQRRGVI